MSNLLTTLKTISLTLGVGVILASCGGGGGSGGSSSGGGTAGGGTGGGSNPTITGLPTLVRQAFPEGELGQVGNEQNFNLTVSDPSEEPSNLRLVGNDADFFEVFVALTQAAAGSTSYELSVDPSVISDLDFENPSDQGMDNIYNFDVAFDYDGQVFTIPFEITITNVAEVIPVTVGFFEGIDTALKAVPDYSGDGNSELLLSGTQSPPTVLGSEDIEASRNSLTSFFDNFLTTTIDQQSFTSDIRAIDFAANATGGINALIQPSASNTAARLFDLNSDADFSVIRGSVTEATDHASVISYDLPNDGVSRFPHVRLTSDINGDGLNDILFSVDTDDSSIGPSVRSYGIIFGRAAINQADRVRTLDADVVLNLHPNNFTSIDFGILVHRVPDLDGDGIEELVIDDRVASAIDIDTGLQVAEGIYTFIYSSTINSGSESIDAWNLNANEGFQLYTPLGLGGFSEVTSAVTIGSDYDGDGSASVIIPFNSGMLVADMDELATLSSILDVTTLPGFLSFAQNQLISAAAVGDLDGDGQSEVMFNRGVIPGQLIAEKLTNGTATLEMNETVSFNIGNVGGSSRVERIVDLPDQGLIALSGFDGTFLVERTELETGFSQADGGLVFNVGN